jgi:predicted peptidase
MGGGGTWNMLSRYPEQFAAAVPICPSAPDADFDPAKLVGRPIWAFHARDDQAVSNAKCRRVVEKILAAADRPAQPFPPHSDGSTLELSEPDISLRYTEWPTGGHAIWNRVYASGELNDWLFNQQRSDAAATSSQGGE